MNRPAAGRDLTKEYWEELWDAVSLPQEKTPDKHHELHRLFWRYLAKGRKSFLEIGCAPGGWMAYFWRRFGYEVHGVENARRAWQKTVLNMRMLAVPSEVHHADFLGFSGGPYDVVFSSGFVEHFQNTQGVIERVARVCKPSGGTVVTIIPNMTGLNWWVSRTFRPEVARGHYVITKDELRTYHERAGLKTHYVGYLGCCQLLPPLDKNLYAAKHPGISRGVNLPFMAWNKAVSLATMKAGHYPQTGCIARGIVYIGARAGSARASRMLGDCERSETP